MEINFILQNSFKVTPVNLNAIFRAVMKWKLYIDKPKSKIKSFLVFVIINHRLTLLASRYEVEVYFFLVYRGNGNVLFCINTRTMGIRGRNGWSLH